MTDSEKLGTRMVEAVRIFVGRALAPLHERIRGWEVKAESAEHRLSRHAQHLATLESRVKALEQR